MLRFDKAAFKASLIAVNPTTMNLPQLPINRNFFFLVFVRTISVLVVGQQYEVGTWAPEDLEVDIANKPALSPSMLPYTNMPSVLLREYLEVSLYPSLEKSTEKASFRLSTNPSSSPTFFPTFSEAPSISSAPYSVSTNPSTSPSIRPSAMPSSQCHDRIMYRSSINSLNCSQHFGTDCFQWKHLGLTPIEIEELIVSCPVACGIDCGSLFVFSTNITYQLQYVDNFLAPESTLLFEDASSTYITKHIQQKNERSKFSLNRVELLSQRILEKTEHTRRKIRSLQISDSQMVDLNVTVAFRGFVLDLNQTTIDSYIIAAIQTYGYMRALRFTNDPALKDVEVALKVAHNESGSISETTASNDNNSSPWAIVVSVFAVTGIVAILLLYIKLRTRDSSSLSVQPEKDIEYPMISPASSAKSMVVPNFSYESVVRFAGIGLAPRTETPISPSENTEDESTLRISPNESIISTTDIADDPCSSILSTTDSVGEDHPLTGVIPAMIVYECIDDDEVGKLFQDMTSTKEKCKNVVPTRHVAATTSFRKALQENSLDALDKSMFVGISDSYVDASNNIEQSKSLERVIVPKQISTGESMAVSDASTDKTGFESVTSTQVKQNRSNTSSTCQEDAISRLTYHKKFPGNGIRTISINAPYFGKLGLTVQSSDTLGHIVVQVKDYSPLKGEIQAGDRIVKIDGQDTTGMPLKMVTNLIGGEGRQVDDQKGTFNIVVLRTIHETLLENVPTDARMSSLQLPNLSGHQRSISASSLRSSISAPLIGSHRIQRSAHRHSMEQSRKPTLSTIRHQDISSSRSTRSTPSTPSSLPHGTSIRPSHRHLLSRSSDLAPAAASLYQQRRYVTRASNCSKLTLQKTKKDPNEF